MLPLGYRLAKLMNLLHNSMGCILLIVNEEFISSHFCEIYKYIQLRSIAMLDYIISYINLHVTCVLSV